MVKRFKLPDGSIKKIKVPDDWTNEQIQEAALDYFGLSAPEEKEEPKDQYSYFKKALNQQYPDRSLRPAAASALRFGENIFNIPSDIEKALFSGPSRFFGQVDLGSKKVDLPEEQKTLVDRLTGVAPEVGLSMFSPVGLYGRAGEALSFVPKAGQYLKTILQSRPSQEAITQGLIASGFAPEQQGKAGAEAFGIALPIVGTAEKISKTPALNAFTKSLRSLIPSKRAEQSLLEEAEKTEFKPILEAAQRQNLPFVTPGEAIGDEILLAREAKLGRGNVPLTREKIGKFAERAKEEERIINSLEENIIPKSDYEKIDKLYKEVNPTLVPKDKLDSLQENETYKAALNRVLSEPESIQKLKGVPRNSIEFQQEVKEALDKRQFELLQGTGKKSSEVNKARRELIDILDEASPKYKTSTGQEKSLYEEARSLREKQYAREGIEKFFDARDRTGENLAKYLKSKETYDDLSFHLRNNPKALQQLKDMKLIFGKIEGLNTNKAAREAVAHELGIKESIIKSFVDKLTGKHAYDEAGIKLITDPNWAERLHKLSQKSKAQEILPDAMEYFGKIVIQEEANRKKK